MELCCTLCMLYRIVSTRHISPTALAPLTFDRKSPHFTVPPSRHSLAVMGCGSSSAATPAPAWEVHQKQMQTVEQAIISQIIQQPRSTIKVSVGTKRDHDAIYDQLPSVLTCMLRCLPFSQWCLWSPRLWSQLLPSHDSSSPVSAGWSARHQTNGERGAHGN